MKKSTTYKVIFWAGYTATLVAACIPLAGDLSKIKIGVPSFQVQLDQLLHFIIYLFIILYYRFGARRGLELFKNHSLGKYFVTVFILAAVTESVQLIVPARTFNVLDLVANVGGLVAGTTVVLLNRSNHPAV